MSALSILSVGKERLETSYRGSNSSLVTAVAGWSWSTTRAFSECHRNSVSSSIVSGDEAA